MNERLTQANDCAAEASALAALAIMPLLEQAVRALAEVRAEVDAADDSVAHIADAACRIISQCVNNFAPEAAREEQMRMTNWPTKADGTPMKVGEMTPEQHRAVFVSAARRVRAEMQRNAPAISKVLADFESEQTAAKRLRDQQEQGE